ncbi:MAG: hypothetical protein DRO88_04145 [Promethearchaeia archaeon]|nr:MAG: hypothetical protein DRO88_04145 [Candidatus Lokiarchaeia archaeon]
MGKAHVKSKGEIKMKNVQNDSKKLLKWGYQTAKWLFGICISYMSFTLILSFYIFIFYKGPIRLRNSLPFFTDDMLALYDYLQISAPAVEGEFPNFWRLWWLFLKPIWNISNPNESFLGKWLRNLFIENNSVFILIILANMFSMALYWTIKTRDTKIGQSQKAAIKKYSLENLPKWIIIGIYFIGLGLLWFLDFIFRKTYFVGFYLKLYIWCFYVLFIGIYGYLNYLSYFLLEKNDASIPGRQAFLFILNCLPIFDGYITQMWYMAGIFVDYDLYFWPQVVTLKTSFMIWIFVLILNMIQRKISQKLDVFKNNSVDYNKSTQEINDMKDGVKNKNSSKNHPSSRNQFKIYTKTYIITTFSFVILFLIYFLWDLANNSSIFF